MFPTCGASLDRELPGRAVGAHARRAARRVVAEVDLAAHLVAAGRAATADLRRERLHLDLQLVTLQLRAVALDVLRDRQQREVERGARLLAVAQPARELDLH